jgi:alkylated DNA repair dioxygenase AlkB
MAQLALFDSEEIVVLDEGRGRFVYTPGLVDRSTAQRWFDALRSQVVWRTERRMMYDREVDVPRLLGGFRLDPPPAAVPAALLEARDRVVQRLNVPFTAVGLNLYRDGRDSVAPHHDRLNEIVTGSPIALLSLGATRQMVIRQKAAADATATRRAIQLDLASGSLFVMDYATQLHYTHAVPKTPAPVAERISLAFRVKP